uniref:Uncharacterized protein n=1 Tax=Oncorhynchus kisutch TaxID=8019 RepID=A0A8C7GYV7_ONCKI
MSKFKPVCIGVYVISELPLTNRIPQLYCTGVPRVPQTEKENTSSVKMLTDEVSQIQEVRYCLKTLREQMATRQNNKVRENSEDSAKIREVSKRLYAQLKESEKRHKEERDRMQAESDEFSRRLDEQSKHLQWVEGEAGERGQKVEELQRLLGGMELEGAVLRGKIAASEAELLQLRAAKEGVQEKKQRTEELEKELAVLKEKIHHLDDMLKSQQRKVRHMIEQVRTHTYGCMDARTHMRQIHTGGCAHTSTYTHNHTQTQTQTHTNPACVAVINGKMILKRRD